MSASMLIPDADGDRVEILGRSDRTMRIDDMNSYWYQVRRVSDDLIGWSYGYFLDLEEFLIACEATFLFAMATGVHSRRTSVYRPHSC